jgi:hypothetical protein
LVFKSKFAGFVVKVRSEATVVHPSTGVVINKIPALRCEFGEFGAEYDFEDPDGNMSKAADIRGHVYDTDAAAAQASPPWTAEEKDTVEQVLLQWCDRWPEAIWLHSEAPAVKPWPKYDETHHKSVPTLAEQLGLVAEAVTYEKQNKNRPEVVEKLTAILNGDTDTAVVEDALTAA